MMMRASLGWPVMQSGKTFEHAAFILLRTTLSLGEDLRGGLNWSMLFRPREEPERLLSYGLMLCGLLHEA